jgi:predicted nucleic acid-binding protein
MVIVDSSVLIDLLRGTRNESTVWLRDRGHTERFGITTLILCEVLQGLRTEADVVAKREDLSFFGLFETGDRALAEASARNFRELRRRGITIRNTIDCMIATFCIQEGYRLLHNDRDFDAFEAHLGLRAVHPPESILH